MELKDQDRVGRTAARNVGVEYSGGFSEGYFEAHGRYNYGGEIGAAETAATSIAPKAPPRRDSREGVPQGKAPHRWT